MTLQNRTKHLWGWLVFIGILLMLVGGLAIASPFIATLASMVVLGYILLVGGIFQAVFAFSIRKTSGFLTHLLLGVFGMLIGVLIIAHPSTVALTITLLIAIFFLTLGLFRFLSAIFMRYENWGWFLFAGILDLVLGILILSHWPSSAIWIIGLFIGLDFIFTGWAFLTTALVIKENSNPHKIHD